ncbi:acetyltransferase [Arthrobacter sp. RIT-PI-e]|uniref:GNAT family N-acetyltransferase n=1 Tax=Arthrobacter sp. RIT-PI-e TaxID=1681197 RepID=UPI000675EDA0|nr:GNAT family N-acetyltransferase [Arthrobacter sp. RIT-PI-e]KNC19117.1 acetyltransferase [Arthrobacter sp. RIT-PI-e]
MIDTRSSTRFLASYDEHLRTDAETAGAVDVVRLGSLLLATFLHGRGFVTYRELGTTEPKGTSALVAAVLDHYRADPGITRVEWKTRGHDHAPGLHEALTEHGFLPDASESIMIGAAEALRADLPLPEGVTLRRVTQERDVQAMSAMQDEVFGNPVSPGTAEALLSRLSARDGTELWVAEADGRIISAGRLEPVDGTCFAGIWGGTTLAEWRGRGIYRALTARRARSALDLGRTLIHSDSTEYSRPILERSGLTEVGTTKPYHWQRQEGRTGVGAG